MNDVKEKLVRVVLNKLSDDDACTEVECSHRDSLHRHHDGCPSCAELGE